MLENMLVMLGSGLLLNIDEEKAHLPPFVRLLSPFAVWTCTVSVRSAWARCWGPRSACKMPTSPQGGQLSDGDLGFFTSARCRRSGLWASDGWCGLSWVSSDSSGAVEQMTGIEMLFYCG